MFTTGSIHHLWSQKLSTVCVCIDEVKAASHLGRWLSGRRGLLMEETMVSLLLTA